MLPRLYSDSTRVPIGPGVPFGPGVRRGPPRRRAISHVRSVHAHEVQAPAGRIAQIPIVLYNTAGS